MVTPFGNTNGMVLGYTCSGTLELVYIFLELMVLLRKKVEFEEMKE